MIDIKKTYIAGQLFLSGLFISLSLLQACSDGGTDKTETMEVGFVLPDSLRNRPLFAVQILALQDDAKARELTATLRRDGQSAYIDSTASDDAEVFYRLQLGPFLTREEAVALRDEVKETGYAEAFVRPVVFASDSTNVAPEDSATAPLGDPEAKGKPKQLTKLGDCSNPRWSPTGREIAFFRETRVGGGIYAIGTGGGAVSKIIASQTGRLIAPTFKWSPYGQKLALVVQESSGRYDRVSNLYTIGKSGNQFTRLTKQSHLPFEINNLKWSPDGRYLAFTASRNRDTKFADIQGVWILPVGTSQNNSRKNRMGAGKEISFSSGRNLGLGWLTETQFLFCFSRDRNDGGTESIFEIWVYDLRDKTRERLVSGAPIRDPGQLELLPEQKQVIYTRLDRTGDFRRIISAIVVLDLSSGEEFYLYDAATEDGPVSQLHVRNSEDVLFKLRNRVVLSRAFGQTTMFEVPFYELDFTASPSAQRLCLVHQGDLYTVRLK